MEQNLGFGEKKKQLKKKSLIASTEDQAMKINMLRKKYMWRECVGKKCRGCGSWNETVADIVTEFCKLAQKEY